MFGISSASFLFSRLWLTVIHEKGLTIVVGVLLTKRDIYNYLMTQISTFPLKSPLFSAKDENITL